VNFIRNTQITAKAKDPKGFRILRLPKFLDHKHMKVARLSVLCTPRTTHVIHFCLQAVSTQGL